MKFVKATKKQSFARVALVGVSGAGKTYSALRIMRGLLPTGRIAVIDSERGSASKYSNVFEFNVLELDSFSPITYVQAIEAAAAEGSEVAPAVEGEAPAEAATIAALAEGDADMVSMARPFLADAEFVNKAAAGTPERINTCIGCNQACLDHVFQRKIASCLVNPRACNETELVIRPAAAKKKVAVVGAVSLTWVTV